MNRYTAVLRTQTANLVELRRQIDRELSRGLLAYRLGEFAEGAPGEVLVEVVTEIERRDLTRLFQTFAEKLGFEVERVGWGWLLTEDRFPGPSEVRSDFGDPLLVVEAQHDGNVDYRFLLRPLLLYLGRTAWILASVGLVLGAAVQGKDVLFVFAMVLWSFIMFAPTGSFSRVSSLRVDEEGIEIGRWIPRSIERVGWRELDGMDLTFRDRKCSLLIRGRKSLISLSALQGETTWLTVARTIAERANLNFVGGVPFGHAIYRRFDAD